jgi:uncharacterized phiE125 gp8 family phage protein
MTRGDSIVAGPAAQAEAKLFLRAGSAAEDALIERLLVSALELCEAFTGQVTLARGFVETLPARTVWARLSRRPVSAITSVEAIDAEGVPLPAGAYQTDIDAAECGWVRVTGAGDPRAIRVRYRAGLAADWTELPEPLAQGALRLTGHLFAHRAGQSDGEPPAAVTALWRPYRLLRVA